MTIAFDVNFTRTTFTQSDIDAVDVMTREIWLHSQSKRSKPGDVSKARPRHGLVGKLGEMAVSLAVPGATAPSVAIWNQNNDPRFAIPDILTPTLNLHVKTCEAFDDGTESWMVEMWDKALKHPLPNDWFVFCRYEQPTVEIVFAAQVKDFKDLLGQPRADSLRHSKWALYAFDVNEVAASRPDIHFVHQRAATKDMAYSMRKAVIADQVAKRPRERP